MPKKQAKPMAHEIEDWGDQWPEAPEEKILGRRNHPYKYDVKKHDKMLSQTPRDLIIAITECDHAHLKASDAVEYIRFATGRAVTAQTFYRIRAYLNSMPGIEQWLNTTVEIGVVLNHKQAIENLESHLAALNKMFMQENAKPLQVPLVNPKTHHIVYDKEANGEKKPRMMRNRDRDPYLILNISKQIESIRITLDGLYQGAPIINRIKKVVNDAKAAMLELEGLESKKDNKDKPTISHNENQLD